MITTKRTTWKGDHSTIRPTQRQNSHGSRLQLRGCNHSWIACNQPPGRVKCPNPASDPGDKRLVSWRFFGGCCSLPQPFPPTSASTITECPPGQLPIPVVALHTHLVLLSALLTALLLPLATRCAACGLNRPIAPRQTARHAAAFG